MALFEDKAPWIMALLIRDFGVGIDDAAAILGNIGQECGGFLLFQEQKPLVPGSKGGFGWCQWTGPRRRSFEAYVARNHLDAKSDKANYGFLFVELKGDEKAAIPALKATKTLDGKVKAFERSFERSGIPNYPSRLKWAKRALASWDAAGGKPTLPGWALPVKAAVPPPAPVQPPEPSADDMIKAQTEQEVLRQHGGVVMTPENSTPAAKPAPKPAISKPVAAVGGLALIFAGLATWWHEITAWVATHWPF